MGDALSLWLRFGRTDILLILRIPTHQYGVMICLFSSLIFFHGLCSFAHTDCLGVVRLMPIHSTLRHADVGLTFLILPSRTFLSASSPLPYYTNSYWTFRSHTFCPLAWEI